MRRCFFVRDGRVPRVPYFHTFNWCKPSIPVLQHLRGPWEFRFRLVPSCQRPVASTKRRVARLQFIVKFFLLVMALLLTQLPKLFSGDATHLNFPSKSAGPGRLFPVSDSSHLPGRDGRDPPLASLRCHFLANSQVDTFFWSPRSLLSACDGLFPPGPEMLTRLGGWSEFVVRRFWTDDVHVEVKHTTICA